jgi:hypothetical protein
LKHKFKKHYFSKDRRRPEIRNPVAASEGYRWDMKPLRAFTAHPASVGESYVGHLRQAAGFGLRMIGAGLACLIHGLFPFLCMTTGSDAMSRLHAEMAARRARACTGGPGASDGASSARTDTAQRAAVIR